MIKRIATACLMLISVSLFCQTVYLGADLSYVNQMEDCGGQFAPTDPYTLFAQRGANLARFRLWHTPSWQDVLNSGQRYSDLQDVVESLSRARAAGMETLLDFHLSDIWADPGHQVVPAAWVSVVDQTDVLGDSLFNYVYSTLIHLQQLDLLPSMVQIGNETNKSILLSQQANDLGWQLQWPRNAYLFNKAIAAIRNVEDVTGRKILIALHFANPTEAIWLTDQFLSNDVTDFDIVGLSYYYQYHPLNFIQLGNAIESIKSLVPQKEVIIFETAYPYTSINLDPAQNLLSTAFPGYAPFSPENQKKWMVDLVETVIENGGSGVIYWEPSWVSTACFTQWAQGSHWDNATFFNADHSVMDNGGIGFYSYPYTDLTKDIIGNDLQIRSVYREGAIYLDGIDQLFGGAYRIFDMRGKCVSTGTLHSSVIPCKLSSGLYVMTFSKHEGNTYTLKLSVTQ